MALCPTCPPIVAVKQLPISLMATFKALGVSHLFLSETQNGQYTQLQWRQAAVTAGLKYIDYPSSSVASDDADANLVAFALSPLLPDNTGVSSFSYSSAASAIRSASTKPIYGLFKGSSITQNYLGTPPYNGSVQLPYLPTVDWVGQDWEPLNTDPTRYQPSIIGTSMQLLGSWSGGKPQLGMVESVYTNSSAGGRAPTPAEYRTEVDIIMAHPASLGWIVDTRVLAGGVISFSFDGSDSSMKTAIGQSITAYTPVATTRAVIHQLFNDGTWT